jgi:hypothetical protein
LHTHKSTGIKILYEYPVKCLIVPTDGALPQTLIPFLSEHKKVIKKSQGCLRIARKTSARRLKSFKLACRSNRKDFLAPTSLVFRLSGRGQSVHEEKLFILAKVTDTH